MAVPALVLVLAVALGALRLGVDRVRAVDAAHVAARLVARGEPEPAARRAALEAAPPGTVLLVTSDGPMVRTTVSVPLPQVLVSLGVPPVPSAHATARREPAGVVP